VEFQRASGILLHPTSLPEGRLGEGARAFVRWLKLAGQTWWQMLPLGPPDETGSPYQARSSFALWPGLLEHPHAAVTEEERTEFRGRSRYWIDAWERFEGAGALDDQVRADREWKALRRYAREHGVSLLGDVPIYTGSGSDDVAERPGLFLRGEVAGAPPDGLSDLGQLWGNPLHDWRAQRKDCYRWWIERLRRAFELVDAVRIDHFRGFVAYWAVPAGAADAGGGRWRRGPGRALFDAVKAELGELPLVAENLGVITPPVERLRLELGFAGMHVLMFMLGGTDNVHQPRNHEQHAVVYTTTHDTETAVEWWQSLSESERQRADLDPAEPHWSLIRLALSSRAELAIVPAQDVLGLGSEGRMNRPGTIGGNWSWRLGPGLLDDALADRLRAETEAAGRC
jgi:4-alpha-glucanotransferase